MLKLAKKIKEKLSSTFEPELFLFENHSLSSFTLSSKKIGGILKNIQKASMSV